VAIRRAVVNGRHELRLHQERFRLRPKRTRGAAERWPVPWVARVFEGRSRRGRLERKLLTRVRERIPLGRSAPRFVYGNAEEGGFFRPLHDEADLEALLGALPSLSAVERMGLVDHEWALMRSGRRSLVVLLDLAEALSDETDPDVLSALARPLGFVAHSLIPDASPESAGAFREWLSAQFAPGFRSLGWDSAPDEADEVRLRRAALLGLVGRVAEFEPVVQEAAERCDRYLDDRQSLEANLADAVMALGARAGGSERRRRLESELTRAGSPQEQRRFLLALADFGEREHIDQTLDMTLGDRVPTQDVIFLLVRLLANPAARIATWEFIQERWSELRPRLPSLLAGRLIEATPSLLDPRYRVEVSEFFKAHPVPSGDRALRQALERFDWYKGFRRRAAANLVEGLAREA